MTTVITVVAAALAVAAAHKAWRTIKYTNAKARIGKEQVKDFGTAAVKEGLITENDTGWRDSIKLCQKIVDTTNEFTVEFGTDVSKWPIESFAEFILVMGGKK